MRRSGNRPSIRASAGTDFGLCRIARDHSPRIFGPRRRGVPRDDARRARAPGPGRTGAPAAPARGRHERVSSRRASARRPPGPDTVATRHAGARRRECRRLPGDALRPRRARRPRHARALGRQRRPADDQRRVVAPRHDDVRPHGTPPPARNRCGSRAVGSDAGASRRIRRVRLGVCRCRGSRRRRQPVHIGRRRERGRFRCDLRDLWPAHGVSRVGGHRQSAHTDSGDDRESRDRTGRGVRAVQPGERQHWDHR